MKTPPAELDGPTEADAPAAPAARQAWLDLARAIAIILVVAGHTGRGLNAAEVMQGPITGALDRVIYSFHIPLFFLISGWLFAKSIRRRPFLHSWKTRTLRLVHPYVVWSIVLLVLLVLAGGLANVPVDMGAAVNSLLFLPIRPISIFWFLYTLLLCMGVSALTVEWWKWTPRMLLFGSIALHLVYLFLIGDFQPMTGLPFIRFAEHQLYFAIGFFFSCERAARPVFRAKTAWLAAFTIVATACFILAAFALVRFDLSYHSPIGTFAALGGCAAVLGSCFLLTEPLKWRVPGVMRVIASRTLAIFCMHVPFISGARITLTHLGINDPLMLLAVCTAIGLAGPLAALRVIAGLGLARLAGFPDEQRGGRNMGFVHDERRRS